MAQPPQNYDLTAVSTTLILFAAAIFFWLCVKVIFSVIGWMIGNGPAPDNATRAKPKDINEDEVDHDSEDDGSPDEMPELDTKKGN